MVCVSGWLFWLENISSGEWWEFMKFLGVVDVGRDKVGFFWD